jgi:hypothetical protein
MGFTSNIVTDVLMSQKVNPLDDNIPLDSRVNINTHISPLFVVTPLATG